MRPIPFDPDAPEDRGAVRNLQFHPSGTALAAVVGAADHFRELARYRLDLDRRLPPTLLDDSVGLWTPLEAGPDPACSRDLELVALGALSPEGVPAAAVVDTWSAEQAELWFESRDENVPFAAFAFAASGAHFYAAVADPERRGPLVRGWNLDALFEDDAADAELDPFRRPAELGAEEHPCALATDPADKALAVGTTAGAVWLCDARREKPPRKLALARGAVRYLHFAPGGKALLVGSEGGVVMVDVRGGERQAEWRGDFPAAALAPGGEQLALIDGAGRVRFSDRSGGLGPATDPGVGPLHGVAYAPDGLTCALGGPAGAAVILDIE